MDCVCKLSTKCLVSKSASEGLVTGGGDVVGGDRSMKFAEAELRDAAGRLLATCNATFRVFTK